MSFVDDFQRSDAMLWELLQERKTITGFLDAVFGFLRRKTDFYHTKTHAADKIGFVKGAREQLVHGSMQRYDPDYLPHKLSADSYDDYETGVCAPPALTEITIDDTCATQKPIKKEIPPAAEAASCFSVCDYKNGAVFSNYCWSQTLKDIEIHLLLPPQLQSAKLLQVEINAQNIAVRSKKDAADVIFSGKLCEPIKYEDSIWMIDGGKLVINGDKVKKHWWERCLCTEPCIDIKKLDTACFMDELPITTQMQIDQIRAKQE